MQQTGCIHLAGIGTGQQDHPQKALHPPSGQEEQHPRNAEHRVPQAVPEHSLLLSHPLHGTVHHALQIHQRHGRAQHPQIEPGLLAVVEQQGQRLAPHPEQRPRQRREAARQPEHPVQQAAQPGALAPDVGLGDLRHQQHRKAPQQPKGKGEQRQGHPLQAAVCRALARHRPPSTGHRISQSRRAGSAGRRAFSAPNARTASPR